MRMPSLVATETQVSSWLNARYRMAPCREVGLHWSGMSAGPQRPDPPGSLALGQLRRPARRSRPTAAARVDGVGGAAGIAQAARPRRARRGAEALALPCGVGEGQLVSRGTGMHARGEQGKLSSGGADERVLRSPLLTPVRGFPLPCVLSRAACPQEFARSSSPRAAPSCSQRDLHRQSGTASHNLQRARSPLSGWSRIGWQLARAPARADRPVPIAPSARLLASLPAPARRCPTQPAACLARPAPSRLAHRHGRSRRDRDPRLGRRRGAAARAARERQGGGGGAAAARHHGVRSRRARRQQVRRAAPLRTPSRYRLLRSGRPLLHAPARPPRCRRRRRPRPLARRSPSPPAKRRKKSDEGDGQEAGAAAPAPAAAAAAAAEGGARGNSLLADLHAARLRRQQHGSPGGAPSSQQQAAAAAAGAAGPSSSSGDLTLLTYNVW
jgi:hypothetical protein